MKPTSKEEEHNSLDYQCISHVYCNLHSSPPTERSSTWSCTYMRPNLFRIYSHEIREL